jgi:hypothetical protein
VVVAARGDGSNNCYLQLQSQIVVLIIGIAVSVLVSFFFSPSIKGRAFSVNSFGQLVQHRIEARTADTPESGTVSKELLVNLRAELEWDLCRRVTWPELKSTVCHCTVL